MQRLAGAFAGSLALHLAVIVLLPSLWMSEGRDEGGIHMRLTASVRSAAASAPSPAPGTPPTPAQDRPRPRAPASASRPAAQSTEPDMSDYLKPGELDERATPRGEIVLEYPEDSDAQLFDGTLILRVFIDEQGVVQRVVVEEAVPAGYFESSAIAAFLAARFQPATRAGLAVRSQMRIEVTYRLER